MNSAAVLGEEVNGWAVLGGTAVKAIFCKMFLTCIISGGSSEFRMGSKNEIRCRNHERIIVSVKR